MRILKEYQLEVDDWLFEICEDDTESCEYEVRIGVKEPASDEEPITVAVSFPGQVPFQYWPLSIVPTVLEALGRYHQLVGEERKMGLPPGAFDEVLVQDPEEEERESLYVDFMQAVGEGVRFGSYRNIQGNDPTFFVPGGVSWSWQGYLMVLRHTPEELSPREQTFRFASGARTGEQQVWITQMIENHLRGLGSR
jgi:hypothetical protein